MQVSYSRSDRFKECPYKYKLRYLERIKTLPPDNADNALILGTALHTGLEKSVEVAIEQYYMSYPIITDLHINEAIKLEWLIPRAKELLPPGEYELKLEDDDFIGYLDLLAPSRAFHDKPVPNVYDLYDFKYSNNVSNYKKSQQLHIYKYYFEKLNPGKIIKNMYYLMVPKTSIKQKKTEDLYQFRRRIQDELKKLEPKLVQIEYDPEKIIEFKNDVLAMKTAKEFPKNNSYLCNWCDYQKYCEKGEDYMLLPKNERRDIQKIEKKTVWLYGAPFSGKTTFANNFPDPLMLNTDGNIKFVDAPYIGIKDQVTVEGRLTNRILAWKVFKDTILELEKKQNDFKTIIVDLLEDCYEHCRLYMYDQMGISHESDDSFRAWDKVLVEYLSTIKRLMNLDYENIILISHEDTSKDITKKGGDKITAIKPNLREKVANKIAGMVDIVARVVADDNVRILSFKTNEVIFGGGRLNVKTNEIPLDYSEFLKVYEEANLETVEAPKERKSRTPKAEPTAPVDEAPADEAPEQETRTRRSRGTAPEAPVEEAPAPVEPEQEQEAPRTRRSRAAEPTPEPTPDETPVRRTRRRRG